MAADEPRRGRGRPPGKSDARRVAFKLPQHHFDYLTFLVVKKRRFGDTPNDAARFILIRELEAMFANDYHKKEID